MAIVQVEDFTKICRACLRFGDLVPLPESNVPVIFKNLTDIDIEEDKLPKNICPSCINRLRDISTFVESCKSNNEYLKGILLAAEQKDLLTESENTHLESFEDDYDSCDDTTSPVENENIKEKCESESKFEKLVPTRKSKRNASEQHKEIKKTTIEKVSKKRIEECFCNICGKKFTRKGGLKRHSKIHMGIKPFECKICGKTFVEKATLNRHNLTHTGEKPFECNLCGKATTRKDQILEHINKHHPNVVDYDFVITEHKLETDIKYKTEDELKIKNGTKKYRNLCEKASPVDENRPEQEDESVFSETETLEEKNPNNEERQFKTKKRIEICLCNLCGKVFRRRGYLKNHMAIHSKIKPYVCKICGKGFTQRHALTRHNLVHTKERPFQCNLCGRTFTRKEILMDHIKNHEEGKKPYLCYHCGKCFANKVYLSKHLKYYMPGKGKRKETSDEKKCICTICGKQLHSVSYLKTHLLTHTGEKPFICTICGNRFTVQRSLNHHLNIHKGIKPYQCTQCEKAFRTSSSLRKHTLLHTGERPFKCTSCEKGFIRRSHLKRHLRTH